MRRLSVVTDGRLVGILAQADVAGIARGSGRGSWSRRSPRGDDRPSPAGSSFAATRGCRWRAPTCGRAQVMGVAADPNE